MTLERVLMVSALFFIGGLGGVTYCVSNWFSVHNDLLLRYYMEDGIENCHE
jgi:hypothetical protein